MWQNVSVWCGIASGDMYQLHYVPYIYTCDMYDFLKQQYEYQSKYAPQLSLDVVMI